MIFYDTSVALDEASEDIDAGRFQGVSEVAETPVPLSSTAEVDPDWRSRARCIGHADLMYLDESKDPDYYLGKGVCEGCPVRAECLTVALAEEKSASPKMRHGVRGGCSPYERWKMYRASLPSDVEEPEEEPREHTGGKELAACGTKAAYDRHRRRKERVCDECMAANVKRGAHRNEPAACGTPAAYQRHVRKGEEIDPLCAEKRAERLARTGRKTS